MRLKLRKQILSKCSFFLFFNSNAFFTSFQRVFGSISYMNKFSSTCQTSNLKIVSPLACFITCFRRAFGKQVVAQERLLRHNELWHSNDDCLGALFHILEPLDPCLWMDICQNRKMKLTLKVSELFADHDLFTFQYLRLTFQYTEIVL